MKQSYDLTKMDREMLLELDSRPFPPIWICDDYLSMRGMAFCTDRPLYDFLEKIDKLKEEIEAEGYEFNCDKITAF